MLHFTETGAGSPVILLHAFPMDSALWTPQRRALAAAGHHVITPDLPGFGGSPISQEHPSLDVMADEVADLMDTLGLRRAVVGGLSMGGYVAMALLRRHRGLVGALLLADTKAGADGEEAVAGRLAMAQRVETEGTGGLAEQMLGNLLGATTRAERPDVVEAVSRWISAQPPEGIAWAQRAMAGRPDSMADLEAFSRPVLVVYGAEDVLSPAAEAAAMADAARAGGSAVTVTEIPGVGHLSAVEDPSAVTAAISDWLGGLKKG